MGGHMGVRNLAQQNAELARKNAALLEKLSLAHENANLVRENARLTEQNILLSVANESMNPYGVVPPMISPPPGLEPPLVTIVPTPGLPHGLSPCDPMTQAFGVGCGVPGPLDSSIHRHQVQLGPKKS